MKNGPYELVIAPEEYPGDEVIHHINHKKRDNRICNLELKKNTDHSKEHGSQIKSNICTFLCPYCKMIFFREKRRTHLTSNRGRMTFCSRKCIGKFGFNSASREKIHEAINENLIEADFLPSKFIPR